MRENFVSGPRSLEIMRTVKFFTQLHTPVHSICLFLENNLIENYFPIIQIFFYHPQEASSRKFLNNLEGPTLFMC